MSVYKGIWPEAQPFSESGIVVTVDEKPLPPAEAEVPEARHTFGWGGFSPWANRKLLAYSLLTYELQTVLGQSATSAHRYAVQIADAFTEDRLAKFGKQWTLSSEEIGKWIDTKYPNIWKALTSHHVAA